MIFLLPAKIQKRSIMIFVILFISYTILIGKIPEPNCYEGFAVENGKIKIK